MKPLSTSVRDAISRRNAQKALSLLEPALSLDPVGTLDSLREDGVLRFARYDFEVETLLTVAQRIRNHLPNASNQSSATYLDSVLALGSLAPAVRASFRRLQADITPFFFKRYLVAVDYLFRQLLQQEHNPHLPAWQDLTLEELADGFSYYFSLLQENHTLAVRHLNHLPLPRSGLKHMLDNLAEFARIIRFREAELLVAHFPYRAFTQGKTTFVAPSDPNLEKATRWGYMREEDQRHADRIKSDENEFPSLKEFAGTFVSRLEDRMCQIVGGDQPRVRIEIPLALEFTRAFTGNYVFREEVALISDAIKTLFIRLEDIHSATIYKSVTLHQLLKFRRLCTFTAFAQDEFCRRRDLLNTPTHFRSLITHFSAEEAHKLVRAFCGSDHPEEILEVLCNIQGAVKVFDLQRTPVLKVAGQYLVPAAVIANSAVTHNALQATRFRFDDDSSVDPVTDKLRTACAEVGIATSARIEYSFHNTSGEIDLLAFFENTLFAFECKNSLTPCSIHELRQSYGYITKAFKQLSKFRTLLDLPDFVTRLRQKTGFAIPTNPSVTTCVVMGNRMFNGYSANGHSVRNIHELDNAIAGGIVRSAFPVSAEDPYGAKIHFETRMWEGQRLTANDLAKYLGEDPLLKMAFDAMFEYDRVTAFGVKQLVLRSFAQDPMALRDKIQDHGRTRVICVDEAASDTRSTTPPT